MKCEYCGTEAQADSLRCAYCSSEIQYRCSSCGRLNAVSEPKCLQCGAIRAIRDADPTTEAPAPDHPPFSLASFFLKGVTTLFAIGCLLWGLGGHIEKAFFSGFAAAVFGGLAAILDTVLATGFRLEKLLKEMRRPQFPREK